MKRTLQLIIVPLFCIAVSSLPGARAFAEEAYVNEADIQILTEAQDARVKFMDAAENVEITTEAFKAAAAGFAEKLDAVSRHAFTDQLGESYTKTANILQKEAAALKTATEELSVAYENGDTTVLDQKYTAFNDHASAYDRAFTAFNDSIDTNNKAVIEENKTGGLYLGALIVTGVVATASFIWAFAMRQKQSQPEQLRSARRNVALNSLWPLGGALVTFVTYQLATAGGTYTIAWGAIVIGAVFFLKSIVDYARLRKQLTQVQAEPQYPSA